jgi:signal recognition particle subunit SRP19
MMPTMEDFAIPPDEQIHLPQTPDRNYSIVWPIRETFSMKTDNGDFGVIYPSYLDANKTVKQGRRLSLDEAVPQPTVSDMSLVLQSMQIRHVLQPYKGYSRDPETLWDNPGRVLVDLANYQDGNKTTLMRTLAARIPDLPERQQRLQAEAAAKEEEEKRKRQQEEQERQEAAAKKKAIVATNSTTKKKGKKGRKK